MVMNIQPIDDCISELKSKRKVDQVIYLASRLKTLNQETCNSLLYQKT